MKTFENTLEDEILDLIDNAGDYTRGDLQGVVCALVMRIRYEYQKTN